MLDSLVIINKVGMHQNGGTLQTLQSFQSKLELP